MAQKITSTRVVRTSFLVDVSDVVLNLIIALMSGSAVMLVRTLQGAADLITSGLLMIGVNRSKRSADRRHRFGYGREIYFWTLMSGLMMITMTATVSFLQGWRQFMNPGPLENVPLALFILAVGFVTNSYAFLLSYRRLKAQSQDDSIWELFLSSVLVETKATFVLDLMGVMSAILGSGALVLFLLTGNAQFDGIGAMVIGVSISLLAILLILDVKDMLVGRGVTPQTEEDIRETALAIKGVEQVIDLRTMYLGSERLLVNMALALEDNLTTDQIERLIDIIKAEIKAKVPHIHHIQVELETPKK
jgi:cation diffusion facilitator family transporter